MSSPVHEREVQRPTFRTSILTSPLNRFLAVDGFVHSAGEKWPPRNDQTASWEGPDILFVGFQEINPLNAVTVVAGGGLDTVKAWNTAIDCALNCKPLPQEYVSTQVCQLPASTLPTPVSHARTPPATAYPQQTIQPVAILQSVPYEFQ